ncbi:hypothetical protein [Bergeyella sp. RCAD1439]|uniref:hypothetical protein n=1 Tax=Bergeyella anatis TaxID=3113737 RepID=UPI002E17CC35|nr:hypothetical protein [Bergeyella sp. RCAD1439]
MVFTLVVVLAVSLFSFSGSSFFTINSKLKALLCFHKLKFKCIGAFSRRKAAPWLSGFLSKSFHAPNKTTQRVITKAFSFGLPSESKAVPQAKAVFSDLSKTEAFSRVFRGLNVWFFGFKTKDQTTSDASQKNKTAASSENREKEKH